MAVEPLTLLGLEDDKGLLSSRAASSPGPEPRESGDPLGATGVLAWNVTLPLMDRVDEFSVDDRSMLEDDAALTVCSSVGTGTAGPPMKLLARLLARPACRDSRPELLVADLPETSPPLAGRSVRSAVT